MQPVKRGRATRGRMARLVAGSDDVEFKVTVPHAQVAKGLAHFGLSEKNAERRYIYYFDTPELDLLEAGIIVRARRIPGAEHDATIKFRPVDANDVPDRWRKTGGFKIESDLSEKGAVKSASLSLPVAKGLIKRAVAGKERLRRLFSKEHDEFLLDMARGGRLDLSPVVVMGPMDAWRWKFEDPGLPWPLTVELWRRGDDATLAEVSIKAPTVQAAAASGGFLAFLAELGAERDTGQQAKTRWALEYYAQKYRAKGERPAAPPGRARGSTGNARGR